ncbi:MAG: NAD-dependent protein deacylase [Ignavibacteriae bacterium HGW-Ignavibacteriae-4]|jgi:NAD-dependent deacetylase|nr:MAG: NAD-dependent protein deacylase [Ignavibacteriae bacterium HGW-Ignavibacteriae-4]
MTTPESIKKIVELLLVSNNITALTGAGVSAESGIATFRDPEGLWAKFDPLELASIDGFMSNPERVWSWYQYRVNIVNNAKPNKGHYALAEFNKLNMNFNLITQNVDGLHQRAGSENVIELHGSIIRNKCFSCNEIHEEEILSENLLNYCKYCNGLIRPDVVWFGEMLPEREIDKAQKLASKTDLFFSIGTSAEVHPAAELPIISKREGAVLIEINPLKTQLSEFADIRIALPSGEAMPLIIEEYKKRVIK